MSKEGKTVRCYECRFFKPYKNRPYTGKCLDANIKVDAVDYCTKGVKKE